MTHLTLFLTELCNNHCEYCDISTLKKRKTINTDKLREYYSLINKSNYYKIVLTGGEPGILHEDILIEILDSITKPISINTNGLFIKNGYYDKYYDKILDIQYHPVPELDKEIKFIIIDEKIRYRIPVHKLNINLLASFLDSYPDINFEVSPYDSKYTNLKYCLNIQDFKIIYDIIKYRNVTDQSKINFNRLQKIKNITLLQNRCFEQHYIYPSIDFVNSRIKKCICSHTQSPHVPLTFENFRLMEQNNLTFKRNDLCKSCYQCINNFNILLRKNNGTSKI